ncbi:hypothetical protein AB0M54_35210 [Actinoplanes sp. NPDC051470]|uniref:hypothetical protein n=1 Tax=unclassified Actinoplanes TaxID=2626549 RepID=UPI0034302B1F
MRFGVTGHRVLPPRIAEFAADRWRRELPTGSRLHGVSNLADGADQLFAEHVLSAAGTLHVVLPCEGYSDGSRARFEQLRRSAGSVVTMPYAEPSEQAYLAAGQAMVDACDHLFAVWDGCPARGVGGTADVVAYARRRGRPVTVLWLDGVRRD